MNARDLQVYMGERIRLMREAAGLTQEDVAAEMNLSRITTVRTEAGDGQVIKQFLLWKRYCEVVHQDPVRATLCVLFPDEYLQAETDPTRVSRIKRLDKYLHEAAPDLLVDQIDNIFYGSHGSDPEALLQMFTAYLHCPLYLRQAISQQVANYYRQAQRMGQDPIPDAIHPDMEILDKANAAGYAASLEGKDRYHVERD